ncbi:MAG: metallophosphoesterase [Bryobacteraceae bacterium]
MISKLSDHHSLAERLKPRIAIEEHSARTGIPCRRHPLLSHIERLFLKPLLRLGLKISGLYPRGAANALGPVLRSLRLECADLPAVFDGYRILHISDLHIDGMDGLAEAIAEKIAGLRVDLCVFTGDYRFHNEGSCERVYPRLERILSSIHAEQGIYGILGNHDASEIAFRLEEMGVRMLVNEAAAISKEGESVWLAGVDDPYDYRCDDLAAALDAIPPESFKVLLAHTPGLYRAAADAGVQVYLCGHTHAGQICFPLLGGLFHHANAPRSHTSGYWRSGRMHGYTSAGAGCSGLPVRFNCPPEVTLIELAVPQVPEI